MNIMFILSSHEHLVKFLKRAGSILVEERRKIEDFIRKNERVQNEVEERDNYKF